MLTDGGFGQSDVRLCRLHNQYHIQDYVGVHANVLHDIAHILPLSTQSDRMSENICADQMHHIGTLSDKEENAKRSSNLSLCDLSVHHPVQNIAEEQLLATAAVVLRLVSGELIRSNGQRPPAACGRDD
ncbi:hypothetical protein F2P81_015555 [Scophthalmus maximus]|uniref:Uncharacterized protein n=1 Tax=Scophthalmus maximus TaxID=52904 RepID=A0A6A4SL44_SCOMX|nr:hypothetical protein F2P81_015555 [Scophthalmus maximus]